uniref:DNA-directed RNA polymerase n=1 Tax=Nitzschia sp. NIES-3576 TaxID=2083273 RepID=A0A2Z5ZB74_9STRA|nr:RNA polymerase beta'' subunit [Nitzschia sp. NIES-3576]
MKKYTYNNNFIRKKDLHNLIKWTLSNYDIINTSLLIDKLKYLGFSYATQGAISISIEDLKVPANKKLLLQKIESQIFKTENYYFEGKITEIERFQRILNLWEATNNFLKSQVIQYFKKYDPFNSVYIMAFSGARGNITQVRQLIGMRGLMANQHGQIIDLPIVQNFQEGLTVTDYLISTYGARKGLIDTALKTADSGYLTRRLVDVAQDIIVRENDCYTSSGLSFSLLNKEDIVGRINCDNILDPITNKILIKKNTEITLNIFNRLKKKKVTELKIRSPLTCKLYRSVCQKCYGWDLSSNQNLVDIGSAVGILAGQSIGEPGTQLTMRTFHTGGAVDIIGTRSDSSPLTGVFQYCSDFEGLPFRTSIGSIGRIIKEAGSAIIIPLDQRKKILKLDLLPDDVIFLKNNQFISEGAPIGHLSQPEMLNDTVKEPIRAIYSGEIELANHKHRIKNLTNDNIIWVLSSKIIFSPIKAFINFYSDYKINKNNSIFRSKINSNSNGFLFLYKKDKKNSLEGELVLKENKEFYLKKSKLQKLTKKINRNNFFLKNKRSSCLLNISEENTIKSKNIFGKLILKNFFPSAGGIPFYDNINKDKESQFSYATRIKTKLYLPLTILRTLIWINEEQYNINSRKKKIHIRSGNTISKGSLIFGKKKSRTSGLVQIFRKSKIANIKIKSGVLLNKIKSQRKKNFLHNKLFFPGELNRKTFLFFEDMSTKKINKLLKRFIEIYEIPLLDIKLKDIKFSDFRVKLNYLHPSDYYLKYTKKFNILSTDIKNFDISFKNKRIKFSNKSNRLQVSFNPVISFNNYIISKLYNKYLNISTLAQKKQYISIYTILSFLENITPISIEIIKIKEKNTNIKHLSLILNSDCFQIKKSDANIKSNEQYIKKKNVIGKILFTTNDSYIIQKGMPYFFPNSKSYKINPNKFLNIKKKVLTTAEYLPLSKTYKNYALKEHSYVDCIGNRYFRPSILSRLENHIYTSYHFMPEFLYEFKNFDWMYSNKEFNRIKKHLRNKKALLTLIVGKKQNKIKSNSLKSFKIVPLVSNLYGRDNEEPELRRHVLNYNKEMANLTYFNHGDYILSGEILGFLNIKKRIANDIVQGLPQISAAFEARKSLKKIALTTFIDSNHKFHKMGIPLYQEKNINPHKFLQIYFTYYGLKRETIYQKNKILRKKSLLNNYEAVYRSFKKVEFLILNFINETYKEQGVKINLKHFEIIIKQMTGRVMITKSNDCDYFPGEIVSIYYIKYLISIFQQSNKKLPIYVPLLFGISRTALSSPSFLSAASFQETINVLKFAAIEGRVDWLRGLKENVITGNLLPVGSGKISLKNAFRKTLKS